MADEIVRSLSDLSAELRRQRESQQRTTQELTDAIRRLRQPAPAPDPAPDPDPDDSDDDDESQKPENRRKSAKELASAIAKAFRTTDARLGGFGKKATGVVRTGVKGFFAAAGLTALLAFINSDFFDTFMDFIQFKFIPAAVKLAEWIGINEDTLKAGLDMLLNFFVDLGDFLLNTIKLITDPDYEFEDYFKENWKGFTAAMALLFVKVAGFAAPIRAALFAGGVVFKLGKWIATFFGVGGALAAAFEFLNRRSPGGFALDTPEGRRAAAAENTRRLSQMSESDFRRVQQQNPDFRIRRTGGVGGTVEIDRPGGRFVGPEDIARLRGRGLIATPGRFAGLRSAFNIAKAFRPIAGVLGVYDIYQIITDDITYPTMAKKGRAIAKILGGMAGGTIMSIFGGLAGGLIGVPGGPLALASAFTGAMAGGYIGMKAGEELTEALLGMVLDDKSFMDALPDGMVKSAITAYNKMSTIGTGTSEGTKEAVAQSARVTRAVNRPLTPRGTQGSAIVLSQKAQERAARLAGTDPRTREQNLNRILGLLEQLLREQQDPIKREQAAAKILNIKPGSERNQLTTIFTSRPVGDPKNPVQIYAGAAL